MCLAALGAFGTLFSAASTAFSVIGSIADYRSQQQYADMQQQALLTNYQNQQQALALRSQEINKQSAEQQSDIAKEALLQRGAMRVASGEAGVSGLIVDTLLADVSAQAGRASARVESDRNLANRQVRLEAQGTRSRAQGEANTIANQRPSKLGLGMQIAGTVGGALSKVPRRRTSTV